MYNESAVIRQQGVLREGLFCPLDCKGKRVIFVTAYEILMAIIESMNNLLIALIAWISCNKK